MTSKTRFGRRTFLHRTTRLGLGLGLAGLGGLADAGSQGCASGPRSPRRSGPPNVVLFLADDLGAADTTEGGSRFHRTPAFARLAREGAWFTDAYSPSSLCSSSRAAILTGKLPHRVGITGAIVCTPGCTEVDVPSLPANGAQWHKVRTPSFLTRLPLHEVTLAEMLRAQGYVTAHIGKWHLGGTGYGPIEQGYHVNVGGSFRPSATHHLSPYGLPLLPNGPDGEYLADRLTDEALAFVQTNRTRPFLLSLFHYGVHAPIEAPTDLTATYASSRDPGDGQRNATYAAMVDRLDASLGRLLDHLDALGLSEDTLVIVTSDNGGLMLDAASGVRVGVTNNAPYRGGKAHIYEGGVRVPFGLRFRGRIQEGLYVSDPVSGIDVLETVADAVGIEPALRPTNDGTSLLPLARGEGPAAQRALTWHLPHYIPGPRTSPFELEEQAFLALPASAVRLGRHKLVCVYGEGATNAEPRYELYDLVVDPGETEDLASRDPETVERLRLALEDALLDAGALVPQPNPAYRPWYDGFRTLGDCTATLGAGRLHVVPTGPNPRLLATGISIATPARLTATLGVAAPATMRLFFATELAPTFEAARSVTATSTGSGALETLVFELPALDEAVSSLRLDLGTSGADVELDSIVATASDVPTTVLARWSFSGVDGVPFGGAFHAYRDTSVAHSSLGLEVVMGGASPSIVSALVQIFGPLRVRIRMAAMGSGPGAVAWSVQPEYADVDAFTIPFDLVHDGATHDYVVDVAGPGDAAIRRLALVLGNGEGWARIERIQVSQLGASGESLVAVYRFGAS